MILESIKEKIVYVDEEIGIVARGPPNLIDRHALS
jgi:hypothetical protein